MGFLIRWGMIGLGGFLVYGGINEAFNGERVSDVAEPMTADSLSMLSSQGDTRYVEVNGAIDTDHVVYETGLQQPWLTDVPTDRVYTLPSPGTYDWNSADTYVGSAVEYSGSLLPMWVVLENVLVEDGETVETGEVRSVRCFATTAVGAGELFFVSPTFNSEDDPRFKLWLEATQFSGYACRVNQLDSNLTLDKNSREAMNLFRSNGIPVSTKAMVVMTYTDTVRPINGNAYAPLAGTDNKVLVKFDADKSDYLGSPLDGIARPAKASDYPGASHLISNLPNRIVVLDTNQTGSDVNNATAAAATAGIVVGLVLLGLGGGWVFALRAARQRQERAMEHQMTMMVASRIGSDTGMGGAPAPPAAPPLPPNAYTDDRYAA